MRWRSVSAAAGVCAGRQDAAAYDRYVDVITIGEVGHEVGGSGTRVVQSRTIDGAVYLEHGFGFELGGTGRDLAYIAPSRPPTNFVGFEQDNAHAPFGDVKRRRTADETATDDNGIDGFLAA